jgi:hypothetical protein
MADSFFSVLRCAKEARVIAEQLSQLCGHAMSLPPGEARRVHEQVKIAATLLGELEVILGKAIR